MKMPVFSLMMTFIVRSRAFFGLGLGLGLVLLTLQGCQTVPQRPLLSLYTPAEVNTDIKYVKSALLNVHVAPFERADKATFLQALTKLELSNFWLQSRIDIYRGLAPIVATLKEAHTHLIYPSALSRADGFDPAVFPLAVLVEANGVFVVHDSRKVDKIPSGAKIRSINGVKIGLIVERMMHFIPVETEPGGRRQVQLQFALQLIRDLGFQPPFKVQWTFKNVPHLSNIQGGLNHARVKATSMGSGEGQNQNTADDQSHWGWEALPDHSRLLWISDFDGSPDQFGTFLANFFAGVHRDRIARIIIDVRYNWGGLSDNVLRLLSYLERSPVVWANSIRIKNSSQFRSANKIATSKVKQRKLGAALSWLPWQYLSSWNWRLLFAGEGESFDQKVTPEPLQPLKSRFKGQLAVVTNGYCFSGCAFFVEAISNHGRGMIVGEEPGSLVGVQYGFPVLITLPNSGLQLSVPIARIATSKVAYPVYPDILTYRTAADIAQGHDPVIASALNALQTLSGTKSVQN